MKLSKTSCFKVHCSRTPCLYFNALPNQKSEITRFYFRLTNRIVDGLIFWKLHPPLIIKIFNIVQTSKITFQCSDNRAVKKLKYLSHVHVILPKQLIGNKFLRWLFIRFQCYTKWAIRKSKFCRWIIHVFDWKLVLEKLIKFVKLVSKHT